MKKIIITDSDDNKFVYYKSEGDAERFVEEGIANDEWGDISEITIDIEDNVRCDETKMDSYIQRGSLENAFNMAHETAYKEITYNGEDKITNIDIWDTNEKNTKLFSKVISYNEDNQIGETTITDEVDNKILTKTITYSEGQLETLTKTMT